jgi:COMPASS component SWD1
MRAHLYHSPISQMLVVTLHTQVQPVFVDLRPEIGGRWELTTTQEEEEEAMDEDDEDAPRKTT